MRKFVILAILILAIIPRVVLAQAEYQAGLFPPDLTRFPAISTFLDVHAPDGSFVHGLTPDSVQVIEDGRSLPVDELRELRQGVQVSVVLNTSSTFANRNSQGVSRFDYIRQYLETWAQSQRDIASDELGLFTNTGIEQTKITASSAWLTAFQTYKPDLKNTPPSLEPLAKAIQVAESSSQETVTERAILYFSPLPGEEFSDQVRDDLITRAKNARVRIYVWMVTSRNQFEAPASSGLRALAEQTGGQFFAFSGNEPFPEAQQLIDPLRFIYTLNFTSQVKQSGNHNLAVRVNLESNTISSLPISYKINLQPPNPIFVGLPSTITRIAQEDSKNPLEELSPSTQSIEFVLEFPDGLQRSLKTSRLYVDDKLAAENSVPPLNRFNWDLTEYTTDDTHLLQVEIMDELGFTNKSVVLPVSVTVLIPQKNSWQTFLAGGGVYVLFAVVFVLGVLASVLYSNFRAGKASDNSKGNRHDPVSQPVKIAQEARSSRKGKASTAKKDNGMNLNKARLVRVSQELVPLKEEELVLGANEMTWGSDPDRATFYFDDPALEGLQSKVWRTDDGSYWIVDLSGSSGTWLNYTAVTTSGVKLNHGDIIRIGDVFYRFMEFIDNDTGSIDIQLYNSHQ